MSTPPLLCHHCRGWRYVVRRGITAMAADGQMIGWLCTSCMQATGTGKLAQAVAVPFVHHITLHAKTPVSFRLSMSAPVEAGQAAISQLTSLIRAWPELQEVAKTRLQQYAGNLPAIAEHIKDLEQIVQQEPEHGPAMWVELALAREHFAAQDKQAKDYELDWQVLLARVDVELRHAGHVSPADDVAFPPGEGNNTEAPSEEALKLAALKVEIHRLMDEVRNIHGVLQRLLDIADSQRPAGKEGSDPEPIAAANADGEIAPEFEGEDYDNDDSHDYGQYDDGDSYQDEDIDAEADFDDHDIDWGDKYD